MSIFCSHLPGRGLFIRFLIDRYLPWEGVLPFPFLDSKASGKFHQNPGHRFRSKLKEFLDSLVKAGLTEPPTLYGHKEKLPDSREKK